MAVATATATLSSSSSLPFHSLHQQFPSKYFIVRPITLSLSEKIPTRTTVTQSSELTKLPIRKIPGDYGLPLIGPWKDRQDYFYNQGKEEFFRSRVQKYKSTVFKTNMPPGNFISSNPNVVVLLDGKSFPILFDVSKVEKKDLFTGTFMPSTELTGGYRVLSYLDPSEPNHEKLKKLLFFLLSSRRDYIIPQFHESYTELFETLEKEMEKNGKADLNSANDQAAFNFLAGSLYGANPGETQLGTDGPTLIGKWVLFQLHPLVTLGLPKVLDDFLLHNFRLPPALVKKDYQRLYDFFYESSTAVLNEAETFGISREEACHNLLFATCFNSFGGMKIFFPNMLKWIAKAGLELHTRLANEIRSAVKSAGGKITMLAMEKMPLMKSVVYEALRIDPPVASQYGRAKRDLMIESHDAVFEVKKGELLFGYQPFATKDPKIFDRPDEFVPDRFVGEEGEKLLKHVLWSNGPETESPTVENKQCAGKDFVVLVSRLFVTEVFLRYDTLDVDVGTSPLGAKITITSLKRA
ncbi:allene oxide synthase, chloroplastic-like [Nicotiana tabacum]|uniref:Allene oxide synthase, chloroplastic-like n=1 Tax=Nicotiana tabacum TaxID=4097 RepID=L8B431_TOBAC|nr:allene oxide synthase, chloroplastic-like [Nicotiana tabacum]BAM76723.1 allene oxyde synthase [Nicotiana tabacum]